MHPPQGQVFELPKILSYIGASSDANACIGYKGSISLAFLWFSC